MTTQLWLQTASTLQPWEVDVRFPFYPELRDAIKELPGARWEEPKPGQLGVKRFVMGDDLVPLAIQRAAALKVPTVDHRRARRSPEAILAAEALAATMAPRFPQQLDAAKAAAQAPAYLFNFSMGLGKTWSAIAALRLAGIKHAIVVAPAMAREVWLREITKFWPAGEVAAGADGGLPVPTLGGNRPSIKVLRDSARSVRGRKRQRTDVPDGQSLAAFVGEANAASRGWILVLSYGLLHVLQPLLEVGALGNCGAIVCDEVHYLQNPKAGWTERVVELTKALPRARRYGLTGTAVTNNVDSMWHPLHWLFPHRFGAYKEFRWYYMNPVPKQSKTTGELHGYDYKPRETPGGLRTQQEIDARLAELRERLPYFGMRVTKKDVAHLLPPFTVQRLDSRDNIADAVQLTLDALADETTHVRVMCYLHETADALTEALRKALESYPDVAVTRVDGTLTAQQRDVRIEALKQQPRAVLVATISSTKEALDLTKFTEAFYAELSPKLVENIQSLGRGHRLSSVQGSGVTILSTADDDTARRMADKIEALNAVVRAGTEEGGLQTALAGLRDVTMSDEEFADVTKAVLENFYDDGEVT